jgi:site-specific DNA-methyltransferase (adenine-specific)
MSNIKYFKYDWIWKKTRATGHAHAKNMPMKKHEIISVFSRGSIAHRDSSIENRMVYNPQGIIIKQHERGGGKRKIDGVYGKRPSHKERYVQEAKNYPSSVLEFSCEGKYHSTQKPVLLLEYLIYTYTSDGGTVLDFTMGSGSTGVACVNTQRNFIGIELDETYFQVAQKRICCNNHTRRDKNETN